MRAFAVFKPLLVCLHVVEEAVADLLLLRGMSRAWACTNDARRSPFVCARNRGQGVIARFRAGGLCAGCG